MLADVMTIGKLWSAGLFGICVRTIATSLQMAKKPVAWRGLWIRQFNSEILKQWESYSPLWQSFRCSTQGLLKNKQEVETMLIPMFN